MSELPREVLIAFALLPLVVVIVMTWRLHRRAKTFQRGACLREIEAAGGFDAWKRLHFPNKGVSR